MPSACYRVHALAVESNIPLPELPRTEARDSSCSFRLLRPRSPLPDGGAWFHHWRLDDGEPWLSFGRDNAGYRLRFPSLADFTVSPDGARVRCYPRIGTPRATVRHLFLDQVLPLALSQQGRIVLHASAVVAAGGALAFVGSTGQGKSTLTASLVRAGLPLLTDDCLLAEEEGGQVVGRPSYPGLRLWPETVAALFPAPGGLCDVAHYSDKKRLSLAPLGLPYCAERTAVRRLYLLDPSSAVEGQPAPTIERLSPREALLALVRHAYQLDVTDPARLRGQFDQLSRVVAVLPVYRLAFPRDLARLPLVHRAVLGDAVGD